MVTVNALFSTKNLYFSPIFPYNRNLGKVEICQSVAVSTGLSSSNGSHSVASHRLSKTDRFSFAF
jgi:hypothetical protein